MLNFTTPLVNSFLASQFPGFIRPNGILDSVRTVTVRLFTEGPEPPNRQRCPFQQTPGRGHLHRRRQNKKRDSRNWALWKVIAQTSALYQLEHKVDRPGDAVNVAYH